MKTLSLSMLLLIAATGCGGQEPEPQPTSVAPSPGAQASAAAGAPAQTDVGKIVFVGQKEACPCTRKRVDDTWKVLRGVLADRPEIPVEKIQLDVDEERYDELDDLQSIMVAPGIYFFDKHGKLIEMLQGEVEGYKIAEVIR
jgi:hypothetical protein